VIKKPRSPRSASWDCLIDGIRGANGLKAQDGICTSDPGVRHVPRQLHCHDARDKEQRNSGEEERGDNFGTNAIKPPK
jgi:hypothetical protein